MTITLRDVLDDNMGTVWVQPDGPNTEPKPIKAADVDAIDRPPGDISRRYQPDQFERDEFHEIFAKQGAPAPVTTTLTTYTRPTRNWLETIRGGQNFAVYILQGCRRGIFSDYVRGDRLQDCLFTAKGKTGTAMRQAERGAPGVSEKTFGVEANPLSPEFFPLSLVRLTTAEAQGLRAVSFYTIPKKADDCGPAKGRCQEALAVAGSAADPATANVIRTTNYGNTWAATSTDPFGAGEHIAAIVSFPFGSGTRHIVARGLTDAGNPAEVSINDGDGVSAGNAWTPVNVGSTNGEFVTWHRALFAQDQANVWMVTDQGNIYKSENAGLTWFEKTTSNTNQLNAIKFLGSFGLAAGVSNTLLKTLDNGESWNAVSGPSSQSAAAIQAVEIISKNFWWLVYNDGEVWYTFDAGANWSQRTIALPSGASGIDRVNDIHFINAYDGAMAGTVSIGSADQGVIYRTLDGGYNWELFALGTDFDATGIGLRQVHVCDIDTIYAVGEPVGSTAAIYKATVAGATG